MTNVTSSQEERWLELQEEGQRLRASTGALTMHDAPPADPRTLEQLVWGR
jgi:hypothetical protein